MKVLIVEDDFTSREYLKEVVKNQGYTCFTAENGMEGLEVYHDKLPDLILCDIQMPMMNGLELLEELRKEKSNAIIVMLTAFGTEEYAVQSFQKGANNYLKKPIYHKDLILLLKRYDQVLRSRTVDREFPGEVLRREGTFRFKSQIENIPSIVDRLVKETGSLFDSSERTEIEVGLNELIMNAIEHGDLEISMYEKAKALENNELNQLYKERQSDEKLLNRYVTVHYKLNLESCEWIIQDEGQGFDWQSLPNPTIGKNLFVLNGRGIFISRFQFDELEYIGAGNIVRILKQKKK